MIRIRCGGGSSSVFSSEFAACSLARSIESIRNTRQAPFSGLSGARSFSSRICGMVIWRSGPSGAKVRKSGCEEKNSGSSLRFSAVHFSRSAMSADVRFEAQIVLLDLVRRRCAGASPEPAGQRRFTDALPVPKAESSAGCAPAGSCPPVRLQRRGSRRSSPTHHLSGFMMRVYKSAHTVGAFCESH